jgi:hypothetical protein
MNYMWVNIYKIISNELFAFYNQCKHEGKMAGEEFYKKCMSEKYKKDFTRLNPWVAKFEKVWDVYSIDPLHVFASFNSWKISEAVRKEKLKLYYKILTEREFFELNHTELDVFKYFPHIQITRVVGARDAEEQQLVWQFFVDAFRWTRHKNSKTFEELFNKIYGFGNNKNIYGVGLPSLTSELGSQEYSSRTYRYGCIL